MSFCSCFFFLSNVMSLVPKIDEVCHVVQNANFDFVCITESWLKPHIQDSVVSLDCFNLVRHYRKETMHGGVCAYIKDTIPFTVLEDLADGLFEVLWLELRPYRLPRGVNNIVIGVIYHLPSAPNFNILNYLMKCLSTIESRYSGCEIILLGDVNKLDTTRLNGAFSYAWTEYSRSDSEKPRRILQPASREASLWAV